MATPPGTITNVMFFDPNRGGYFSGAPALSLGQTTSIGATGNNTSLYPTSMQLIFIITKPNGTQVTVNSPVSAVAAGNNFASLAPVTVDQTGTWRVEVRLMGEYSGTLSGLLGNWLYYTATTGWVIFTDGAMLPYSTPVTSIYIAIGCQNSSNVPRTANLVLKATPPGGTPSQFNGGGDVNPGATLYVTVGPIPITSNGFVFSASVYFDGVLVASGSRTAG